MHPQIPKASAARLILYLRELRRLHREGIDGISSRQLGEGLGVTDAVVRRDLGYLGAFGQRGIGYSVEALSRAIHGRIGGQSRWNVMLVGVGNLGTALLRYRGFNDQGFEVVAALDVDLDRVGKKIGNVPIYAVDSLEDIVKEKEVTLAILAVPAEAAGQVAQRLADAGLIGILNFAPISLRLSGSTRIANVDLASELQQLAFSAAWGKDEDTVKSAKFRHQTVDWVNGPTSMGQEKIDGVPRADAS